VRLTPERCGGRGEFVCALPARLRRGEGNSRVALPETAGSGRGSPASPTKRATAAGKRQRPWCRGTAHSQHHREPLEVGRHASGQTNTHETSCPKTSAAPRVNSPITTAARWRGQLAAQPPDARPSPGGPGWGAQQRSTLYSVAEKRQRRAPIIHLVCRNVQNTVATASAAATATRLGRFVDKFNHPPHRAATHVVRRLTRLQCHHSIVPSQVRSRNRPAAMLLGEQRSAAHSGFCSQRCRPRRARAHSAAVKRHASRPGAAAHARLLRRLQQQ